MWLITKKTISLLVSLHLISCNTSGFLVGDSVKDKDWNTTFKNNCPLPNHDSIRWMTENERRYLRFTLSDGDKGGCITDKVARHNAPYWERSELKQNGILENNQPYSIAATLRFVEGFNSERETFFQIHAYNKSCKQAGPPIMIKFDNTRTESAVLTLYALRSTEGHKSYRTDVRINDILGEWIDLKLEVEPETDRKNRVSLSMNGDMLLSDIPFWNSACGKMHIKFGAYRPGNLSGNEKSIVDFDSINVN